MEAEIKEKKLVFEKEYAEREKAIAEKEQEYATLKKAFDHFPAELEKAIQQAKTELEGKLSIEFKHQTELKSKETEGILQLRDLQIATLENKIKEMEVQGKILGQKAETANQ